MITIHFPNLETLISVLLILGGLSVLFWNTIGWLGKKLGKWTERRLQRKNVYAQWMKEQQERAPRDAHTDSPR